MPEGNQHRAPTPEERAALEEFHLRALRYLDGLLTDDEAQRFNDQLASSAEYRGYFAALSVEMGILNELLLPAATRPDKFPLFASDHRAPTGATTLQVSQLASKPQNHLGSRSWQLAVAVALVVGGLGLWSWRTNGRLNSQAGVFPDRTPNLEMFDTRLESGHTSRLTLPRIGHVILEGPAEFKMLDPMRARLNSGRIKMRVTEATGHGFVVETPYGEVTDLGTEFGLEVSDKGKAGLVVFEGEVDLRVAASRKKSSAYSRVERLVGGDGVTFDRGGKLDRIMSIVTGKSATFRPGNERYEEDLEPLIAGISDNLRASDTKRFYEIVRGGFGEDARAFVDRAYEWNGLDESGLPEFLIGADYILPFNDDKVRSLEISLSLAKPATVYILFDDRGKPPKWLAEKFERTEFKVGMDEDHGPPGYDRPQLKLGHGPADSIDYSFSVWKREIAVPGSIGLGSREGLRGSRSMYGIVVVPLNTTSADTVDNDLSVAP